MKKAFKGEIPLAERSQWEDWLKTEKREIDRLTAAIERNESEINSIVYRLFDLTSYEIKLLEDNLGRRSLDVPAVRTQLPTIREGEGTQEFIMKLHFHNECRQPIDLTRLLSSSTPLSHAHSIGYIVYGAF